MNPSTHAPVPHTRPALATDSEAWSRFVFHHPEATFFHRWEWREILENAFGHDTHYLLCEAGGHLRGILPLARIKSPLFGDSLISTPFCVQGGIVSLDETARHALEEAAVALAEALGVGHLELRNNQPRRPDWLTTDLYHTFTKPIPGDAEANLLAIPRKQRAEVRKAREQGLTWSIDHDPDQGYALYAESLRNLGTPVFSRDYYRLLMTTFPQDCDILLVRDREQRPLCGVLSFYFRDQVLPYYGGGGLAARGAGGAASMYWALMGHAHNRGARVFDFGRAKQGSGSFEFKRLMGFTPTPLHYEYRLIRSAALPRTNPTNPRYQRLIRLWQHLPLVVANAVGPWLARDLG